MKSSPKGAAATETPADFYDYTRRLMRLAVTTHNPALVRRAAIRVDSDTFKLLPDDQQEELLALYGQAVIAGGALAP